MFLVEPLIEFCVQNAEWLRFIQNLWPATRVLPLLIPSLWAFQTTGENNSITNQPFC